MRVLGIDFSHKKNPGGTYFLLEKALETSADLGATIEITRIADYNILPCNGCGICMNNHACPLLDNSEDEAVKLYEKCYLADAFIFAFPVYAIAPPALMINLFDRAPQVDPEDHKYDFYSYDRVSLIKGKCFKGKVAGLIASSAGMGHEFAMGVLNPMFTALKLTVVASAGISLLEFDQMPQFRKFSWAKHISEADFALDMVRGVGKRVMTGTKAYRYEEKVNNPMNSVQPAEEPAVDNVNVDVNRVLPDVILTTLDGKEVSLTGFKGKLSIILIGKGPTSADCIVEWFNHLRMEYGRDERLNLVRIAIPGELPDFISRDFVKSQMKDKDDGTGIPLLLDWDGILERNSRLDFEKNFLILQIYNKQGQLCYETKQSFSNGMLEQIRDTVVKI